MNKISLSIILATIINKSAKFLTQTIEHNYQVNVAFNGSSYLQKTFGATVSLSLLYKYVSLIVLKTKPKRVLT